ncbi:MAG: MBL fold metallo-hydrolase [Parcubacteria group bacterium]|nr:MBL fold metallo-hydrolase [Parcubacteria group bacterium]
MIKKAKLTFASGTNGPTGSNFLFEAEGKKILVDCGLVQGSKMSEDENREPFAYDPASIDMLFVTHAHLDHVGRIPFLVKSGFKGKIYSTPPTKDLAEAMLEDGFHLMEKEAAREGKEAIYGADDIKKALSLWEGLTYHQSMSLSDDMTVKLFDAGHILGSAMIEITYNTKKILFTGDLGNSPAPLLKDTEYLSDIDYLLIESVYGDRVHEKREERKELLENIIEDTIKNKGVLLLPAFSLERTQELLFEINDLVEHGRIPETPVFLDSPLAIKATAIYKKHESYFNAGAQAIIRSGDDVFNFPMLKFTPDAEDSKAILGVHPPKIIIAGSGMSNGGRILHHEKNYLSDPKTTLLLVGYQAVGTPGRLMQEGAKFVRIMGEDREIRARVASIHGYSAHRDTNGLFDFVEFMKDKVQKVFVVMGEPKATSFLAQRLRDYLGLKAVVPKRGESVELEF